MDSANATSVLSRSHFAMRLFKARVKIFFLFLHRIANFFVPAAKLAAPTITSHTLQNFGETPSAEKDAEKRNFQPDLSKGKTGDNEEKNHIKLKA